MTVRVRQHHYDPRSLSLDAALETARRVWRHTMLERSYLTRYSQAKQAVAILKSLGCKTTKDATAPGMLSRFRDRCFVRDKIAAATYNARAMALRGMGIEVGYLSPPHQLKWFLTDEGEERIRALPTSLDYHRRDAILPITKSFIFWTCATGLRVEETLRLQWLHLSLHSANASPPSGRMTAAAFQATILVPGTKTASAQATIPISEEACTILCGLMPKDGSAPQLGGHIFPVTYNTLFREWAKVRKLLGIDPEKTPTATLKALRRSFARRAHLSGMPVDVLRQFLRHEDIKTTQGYLRLVGGYSADEMRRWL